MTRAKFVCVDVSEENDGQRAKFEAVTSGSEENDRFFDFTPYGSLDMGTVHGKLFEIGKEYYLDFSEATA